MSSYSRRSYQSSTGSSAAQRKAATERNQQILRTLLKDPANKFCADCKVSGHPRWASWSLGIFICIRCSGIHRSMGTHISKVRSIDLDSWNDEQIAPLVKWGNKRANLYWEAKLPKNYVPDDSKIENFIRTKYDLKRWVASPQVPDPATLESSDSEEVPLAEVQKRLNEPNPRQAAAQAQHSRQHSSTTQARYHHQQQQPQRSAPVPDLLDSDFMPARSAPTTATQMSTVSSGSNYQTKVISSNSRSQQQPQPKPAQPSNSLIGLDFGAPPSSNSANRQPVANASQSSSTQAPASTNSRPDLKKSILSLYSTPSPAYQPPPPQMNNVLSGFSNLSLNTNPQPQTRSSNGLDFLSNGSFNSQPSYSNGGVQSLGSQPLSSLGSSTSPTAAKSPKPKQTSAFDDILSGGSSAWASSGNKSPTSSFSTSLNNTKPVAQAPVSKPSSNTNNEWADFTSAPLPQRPNHSTAAFNSTSPNNPIDDDLFANVWK